MSFGVTIRADIGIGDKMQYTSLPENYFRSTGERLIDVSKSWVFDYNPYVLRDVEASKVIELWNFGPKQYEWPRPRTSPAVYTCNAEIWASLFQAKLFLNRPRLYKFETMNFGERDYILLHTHGRSHGTMPDHVIDHVINKYKPTRKLYHIGLPSDPSYGIPKIVTPTLWDLAAVISRARMFIGVDSGPSWIAAAYPDVITKKIRLRTVHGEKPMSEWVPLEIDNIHSHWDDRLFQIYNPSEEDVNFMASYNKL